MLELNHVTKKYLRRTALDDVSLALEPGRTCLLLGPNGSGKTTMMKLIAGLSRPTSGEITLEGLPIGRETKARVAYMPTENYFYNYMLVRDIGKYYADFFQDFDPRRFESLLNQMELDPQDRREGRTMLISTHLVDELEDVVDTTVFLKKGQLVMAGDKREICAGRTLKELYIEVYGHASAEAAGEEARRDA